MLHKIDWNPSAELLAKFSQWAMFFLGMVAFPLALYRDRPAAAWTFWVLAVVIRVLGLAKPAWLRPIYVGLMLVTWPIGFVVSYVTLGVIYYGVFTPVALLFRLIGRDALERRFDPQAGTYWEAYQPDQGLARYLRQF